MQNLSLARLFLHERTVEIILRILEAEEANEKIYPLQISNDIGSPYSYISKVLSEFEKNSIVESRVEGRMRVISLTPYGRKVAIMLRELKKELEKDFNARRKLDILKEVALNGKKDWRVFLPVIAELEILRNSTDDREVIKEVENMIGKVEKMIEEVV
ncbi:winged helix-turn-helix domain-containing protein [Archaeoglobus sp.]